MVSHSVLLILRILFTCSMLNLVYAVTLTNNKELVLWLFNDIDTQSCFSVITQSWPIWHFVLLSIEAEMGIEPATLGL